MHKTLVALLFALSAPAFAQSTITIYGTVDMAGEAISGHAKELRVTSGGLSSSRLGFKGSEDLGGGILAEFQLETGISVDEGAAGQGGTLFGRMAFAQLRTPWGNVSAGRQYSSLYAITGELSAFSNTSVGATTATIGGFAGGYEPIRGSASTATGTATGSSANGGPVRINNSLRYTTPTWSGLRASVLYGAGEVVGGTRATRLVDGSVRYTDRGLDAALSFVDDKAAGASAATATSVTTLTAAASYSFDGLRVLGGVVEVDDRRPANLDGRGLWLGGDYRLGADLFKLQWVQSRPENTSVGKTNACGLGWQHDLSRRSSLYTAVARFRNGGTGPGRASFAIPAGVTVAGDASLSEFVLGVRHTF
jgi:predicted porin